MDPTAIATAYGGLKAAKEIFSYLLDQKIETDTRAKVIEAQRLVGDAQDCMFGLREQLFEMQSQVAVLKDRLAEVEGWSATLGKYQLKNTAGGATVYQSVSGESHYACPSCIAKKEIQVLQRLSNGNSWFDCPACKHRYPIEAERPEPPLEYENNRGGW